MTIEHKTSDILDTDSDCAVSYISGYIIAEATDLAIDHGVSTEISPDPG